MAEDPLKSELNTLERKIKLLLTEHSRMKSDLANYRSENQELKNLIEQKNGELSAFQNKFKISKIVNNMTAGEGDNTEELKEVLNQYIKEIDKCIIHLSEA